MPYQFRFTLNDNDYYEFNKFHLKNTPHLVRQRRLYLILIPVIFFIILFLILLYGQIFLPWALIISAIVAVISFFSIRRSWNKQPEKNLEKMKRDGKLTYQKAISQDFGEDGYTETTEDMNANGNYTIIERIGDGPEGIYLYMTVNTAAIIPNRAFNSPVERSGFLDFIRSKINTGEH